MSRLFTVLLLTFTIHIYSQTSAPKLINYQGVARDAAGAPITSAFDIQFVIHDLSSTVHDETQTNIQPNQQGIFNTRIGIAPTLTITNWNNGPYTMDIHIKTGSTFTFVGTQQLVSVPFALNAGNVASSYTNNILTIGNNSYSITSGSAVTPTINGTGLVTVTPNTGPLYSVDVPTPSLSYVQAGNLLTLTQGTATTAVALTGTGNSTVSMTGSGIASVNPASGSAFTVNVPSSSLTFAGNVLTLTQGAASTSATFTTALSGDVIGSTPATTVTALRTAPISTLLPVNGQLLSFVSGTWTPVTPTVAPAGPWQKIGGNVSLLTTTDLVGIGTSAPASRLNVVETSTTTAVLVSNSIGDGLTSNVSSGRSVLAQNTSSTLATIEAQNTSLGNVILATKQAGTTNGNAGRFINFSATNGSDAVFAQSNGGGAAIHAISGPSVTGGSNAALMLEDGHIKSKQANSPTLSMSTSLSGGTFAIGANCTDVAGTFNFTTGPTGPFPTNSPYPRLTFNKAYPTIPVVILTPKTYPAAQIVYYVTVTQGYFDINVYSGLVGNSFYEFNYMVIEGK